MNDAITYVEQMDAFITLLSREVALKDHVLVETISGRKFDRILIDDYTEFFVDKQTSIIYGAKSPLQYNPRRSYGTLATVEQFDWTTNLPLEGTPIEGEWNAREEAIQAGYKKRGRPRKVVHTQPTFIPKESV
jgi:hypothetical protein